MDPNACLTEIRAAIAALEGPDADLYDVQELVDKFRALDEWMTRGGFAPEGWAR
jgi:hypothetical protein